VPSPGGSDDKHHQRVLKALALQKAFQQVLDTPGAEEALQQQALKPLLDQAAD